MDPDQALKDLRTGLRDFYSLDQPVESMTPAMKRSMNAALLVIADAAAALDGWITGGGFLPKPWEPPTRRMAILRLDDTPPGQRMTVISADRVPNGVKATYLHGECGGGVEELVDEEADRWRCLRCQRETAY